MTNHQPRNRAPSIFKSPNFLILFVSFFCCCICNMVFLLNDQGLLRSEECLLLVHMLLPLSYLVFALSVWHSLIRGIENLTARFNVQFRLRILYFLRLADVIAGVLIIFSLPSFTQYFYDVALYDKLYDTLYFRNLPDFRNLPALSGSTVFQSWSIMAPGFLALAPFILFFAAYRKTKIRRDLQAVIRSEIAQQERVKAAEIARQERNNSLGFEYEMSDFYKQTGIPYSRLCQRDGTLGEFEVYRKLMNEGLSGAVYVFNREIPKNDGLFTECDLIIVHTKGLVVVENKHYTTRIFGNAVDYDLSMIDHAGRKKSIYNPIKQNENHVLALKQYLSTYGLYVDDATTPVYSVVVFTAVDGDSSDDFISGINLEGVETKVCTSQNVAQTIMHLLNHTSAGAKLNSEKISEILLSLSVRKKMINSIEP